MATVVVPVRRARSQSKLVLFVIFGLLTAFVTYMKNAHIFDSTSEIAQHFAPVKWYLVPHAFFGALAMLLGVFQFSNRLRARYLKTHRTLGYVYVVSVFIAAPLAVPMTMRYGPSLVAASSMQSFGWMLTTAIALYCVRHGNVTQHRRWMIRSYALTFAAVTLRIYLPLSQVAGLPFDPAYQTISWFCWVPNLIVAEWIILQQRQAESIHETDSVAVA